MENPGGKIGCDDAGTEEAEQVVQSRISLNRKSAVRRSCYGRGDGSSRRKNSRSEGFG